MAGLHLLLFSHSVNKNEEEPSSSSRQKSLLVRPNTIEGIEPHHLNVPASHHRRSTSEDSLEDDENEGHQDYNQNGNVETAADQEEKGDQSKDSDDEAGQLSDEGLGDITSEASNSPQPPPNTNKAVNVVVVNEAFESKTGMQMKTGQQQQQQQPSLQLVEAGNGHRKGNNNYSLPTSPCDERVPSRIPFPKKQHKSQTNL